ncbi:MAG TPA: DUF4349 domain-containing protein, partial [Methylotenera sp.]|nr:DUF4349 domain-containing protein [Methylotenera sp.]
MKRLLLVLLLPLLIVSCGKQSDSSTPEASSNVAPTAMAPELRGMAKMSADIEQSGAEQGLTELSEPRLSELANGTDSSALKKYIALRHHLQIETSSEQMQASFDAALKHCEALSCELLSA